MVTSQSSGLNEAAAAALALRKTHRNAPTLDTMDLVMRDVAPAERRAQTLQACQVINTGPPSAFGLLMAEALDTGMTSEEWLAFTGPEADPPLAKACLEAWRVEVLPKFIARYAADTGSVDRLG